MDSEELADEASIVEDTNLIDPHEGHKLFGIEPGKKKKKKKKTLKPS